MQIFIKTIVEKMSYKEEVVGAVCCDTMQSFVDPPEVDLIRPRIARTRKWNFCPFCGIAIERIDAGVEEVDVENFDRHREI